MAHRRLLAGLGATVLATVAVLALTRCTFDFPVGGTEEDCGPGRSNVGDNPCEVNDPSDPNFDYDASYTSDSSADSGSRADAALDSADEGDAPTNASDGSDDGESATDAIDAESDAELLVEGSADGA